MAERSELKSRTTVITGVTVASAITVIMKRVLSALCSPQCQQVRRTYMLQRRYNSATAPPVPHERHNKQEQ